MNHSFSAKVACLYSHKHCIAVCCLSYSKTPYFRRDAVFRQDSFQCFPFCLDLSNFFLWNFWYLLLIEPNDLLHSFVFCLTTGPKRPPKRFLHMVRSRASSFKWEYPLLSLRSSSSFLRLLPRLLVASISPFIFPSIACLRRQFLRKMWPIQLAFRFLISCTIFLCSLTLSNASSFLTRSVQLILSILLQHHISKLSMYFWSNDLLVCF